MAKKRVKFPKPTDKPISAEELERIPLSPLFKEYGVDPVAAELKAIRAGGGKPAIPCIVERDGSRVIVGWKPASRGDNQMTVER